MKNFQSVEEILDFAVKEEEASASFYRSLATKMDRPWMKRVFEDFAAEEEGHKRKLLKFSAGELSLPPREKVLDLKIGEYLVDAELNADMDYQQALMVAMKKEKAAFRLYSDLASVADDAAARELLLALAQEEARHKLRFEVEYDDVILAEN
ncbi:MAG: rubrerythrin [Deltaproteobacteria bacterium]|nr:MAG: rubrerythrin [Deltaproteobacteria bacterium]